MGCLSTLPLVTTVIFSLPAAADGAVLNRADRWWTATSNSPYSTRAQTAHTHENILSVMKPLVSATAVALLVMGSSRCGAPIPHPPPHCYRAHPDTDSGTDTNTDSAATSATAAAAAAHLEDRTTASHITCTRADA